MSASIGTWPTLHAARSPESTALIDGATGRKITFADLDDRTSRLASGLGAKGIGRGDRVAILSINSPEMLELLFAVAKLGAITVMINTRLTPREVSFILRDSGAILLFASTTLLETAEKGAEGTDVAEIITLATSEQRLAGQRVGFDELLESGRSDLEPVDLAGDDPAVLMYTSGTTGAPKGAIITHANLFWVSVYHNAFERGLNRFDVSLAAAPLFHIGALALYTLPGLYWGASSVIQETFNPSQWAQLVAAHGVTKAFAVPTMWAAILASGGLDDCDISSLDVAITGGASCPLSVIEALQAKGVRFTEGFGMTETTAMASVLPSEYATSHAGSIGRPAIHVDFRIVGPDGSPAQVGEIGELLVRGPSVSPGYWNRPEATAEAFDDGWFRSGDLATVDEDGFYRIVDRKKDMVISGGENVYPAEIEQVLSDHPAVGEIAVVGTPDATWGEVVTAAIVPTAGAARDPEDLRADIDAFARQHLARFKVPRRIEFVDALPRTATGKVRKVELRTTFAPADRSTP